ncbi:MAG TPA: septum formation initiator family protein [Desulfomonilaceae bacterium]|nr:septum formation initiator family protein [Desulfomonilaceae bacterium]
MKLSAKRAVTYAQFAVAVIVAVSVGMLLSERGLAARQELQGKRTSLQKENERLVTEIKSLEHKVTLLRSDPKTIEKVAKRKLGMTRPEDTVYIFNRHNLSSEPDNPSELSLGTEANLFKY